MRKEIITGIIVGITVPLILAILSTAFGWIPNRSDYRIPKGTIAAFALTEPPDGWEVYEPAHGRVIVGVGASEPDGATYSLEQKGGRDLSRFMPGVFDRGHGTLVPTDDNLVGFPSTHAPIIDARTPFVALLICRKK